MGRSTGLPGSSTAGQATSTPCTCIRARAANTDSGVGSTGFSSVTKPSPSPDSAFSPIAVSVPSGPISTKSVTPRPAISLTESAKRTASRAWAGQ
ncbi:hypothetical protein Kisp01_35880 [Kineosporia sp. NBRC 101677]|nr:hypothetical protein Kisp01_35880 [Kineosporia sp. NBRC 101677]